MWMASDRSQGGMALIPSVDVKNSLNINCQGKYVLGRLLNIVSVRMERHLADHVHVYYIYTLGIQ